jgi:hypothetical protein
MWCGCGLCAHCLGKGRVGGLWSGSRVKGLLGLPLNRPQLSGAHGYGVLLLSVKVHRPALSAQTHAGACCQCAPGRVRCKLRLVCAYVGSVQLLQAGHMCATREPGLGFAFA